MELTYKLIEKGYEIYLNGQLWIGQGGEYGDFIPNLVRTADGSIDYEESCKAHIEALLASQAEVQTHQSQLDTIEANTSYLVMINE